MNSSLCGGNQQLGTLVWEEEGESGPVTGFGNADLTGFSDADFAGDVDARKSTTGVIFFLANSPIT